MRTRAQEAVDHAKKRQFNKLSTRSQKITLTTKYEKCKRTRVYNPDARKRRDTDYSLCYELIKDDPHLLTKLLKLGILPFIYEYEVVF